MGPYSIIESRYNLIYKLLDLKTLRPVKSFIHANRLKPYKDPRDFRPPPNDTANESIEDTEDSDNDDTNENTIKSQVDQARLRLKETQIRIKQTHNGTKLPNY
jgi:hypothetical protein